MKFAWTLVAFLALAAASAQSVHSTLPGATVRQLNRIIRTEMTQANLPGVVVGVWIPGEGNYVGAFGKANLQTGRARMIGDPFRLASISKTFTATAILQLEDEGLLSTSDSLAKWFPDFPNADEITLKNLLMMRSGVPELADEEVLRSYYENPLEPLGPDDAIRLAAAKTDAVTPPDQKTVYTNTNFVLLGRIVEMVSGQDMDTFLAEHVFIPLGMADTFYATAPTLPGDGRGYSWDADTKSFKDITELNPGLAGGAGAVVSTLSDLHTYVRVLCTGELLEPATQVERLEGVTMEDTPNSIEYGEIRYGEGLLHAGEFCGHYGTIFGFSSEAFYLPAKDAVIVVNVNRLDLDDQSQSTELFLRLTKALFPAHVNW